MNTFTTYQDACNSSNVLDLIEHCKEGVIENNHVNNAKFYDWNDGEQIVSVYLENNAHVSNGQELRIKIEAALNEWISSRKAAESLAEQFKEIIDSQPSVYINGDWFLVHFDPTYCPYSRGYTDHFTVGGEEFDIDITEEDLQSLRVEDDVWYVGEWSFEFFTLEKIKVK